MQNYIGTKFVTAEPCEAQKEYGNHKIGDPGYKVIYPDGYESWSPKKVFEEAYRPTSGLTFGLALEAAKKGRRIARAGWNGTGQWVELGVDIVFRTKGDAPTMIAMHEDIGSQALVFCGTRGTQVGWLASQSDMLADDWMLLD